MNLWSFLKGKMENNLQQSVCEEDISMTFGEIICSAEDFSQKLKGVKCCALLCQSEMLAGVALLSCFAAAVTALPLSKRYGELHCKKILEEISPDAIITDQNGVLGISYMKVARYVEPAQHPALIMCTSGTTGIPKGAMLTETNILTNVSDIAAYFKTGPTDTILISRPLYHCAVLTGEFLTALVKGTKIRFYSGSFNPALMLGMLRDNSVTAFCGTPTLLSIMARFKKKSDNLSLQHICISGECMDAKTGNEIAAAFPGVNIYHVYGLTEACPRVAFLPPQLFSEYPDYVGLPLKSVSLRILNKDGGPTKTNEIGVLWVKGDNVMSGYYNNPELTAKVLKDGWLCTGDLAVLNEKGVLKIKGRKDNLIIKAGMNIYPQEIEEALKADSRVNELYVSSCYDEKLGIQIVLNIAGHFLNAAEVRRMCKSLLPAYQMPAKINLMESIPKNGSGKIVRR